MLHTYMEEFFQAQYAVTDMWIDYGPRHEDPDAALAYAKSERDRHTFGQWPTAHWRIIKRTEATVWISCHANCH